ncbi:50S ribosomal protein L4 [Candidatus Lucifugimonas marina]|jgi:large subunit ribosomal protein L4|uniref:Large ribosomal subunit protein uL4 n=1 Tax=Candidatus Lucifugimonas marina TaxID=3038979 RepID=A0AAJ5ZFY0_9CHLR|nr:50S ribosomal protein L4 [SAR202 cluster bacterium JH702]MDG0870086.1 50S ribosomal protein L4 [SAR202 cluster bacterium JH639]WFG36352.1 50S ribosomal protein L4 [SAR202 cluster bacterium JH545]WFG40285.1 50S ribosomal protein L4 [SAR202 cluster bacterium JH1073]
MDLQVKDNKGKVVGSVAASDQVWRAESNDALLHQAVVAQQANKRRGTQDTQTRGEVSFSTRKIRPQKGGGTSRQGSRRSPVRVGGGVAHGPHPRSHRQRLPKKMRQQALRVALSDKVRDESVTILDALKLDAPKSSTIRDIVSAFELKGRTLIVTGSTDQNVVKSASNLPGVDVQAAALMNPLEAATVTNLVVTQEALEAIDSIWADGGDA